MCSVFFCIHLPSLYLLHLAIDKVALLIGNKKYNHSTINHLVNPENDIRELQKLLEIPPINFKVISLVNLKGDEMLDALKKFWGMLAVPGMYAILYYSGYGFYHEGKAHLVPVDGIPPLYYNTTTIAIDSIEHRMKNTLSRAVIVTAT